MFLGKLQKEIISTYGTNSKAYNKYVEKKNLYKTLALLSYKSACNYFNGNENKKLQCIVSEIRLYEYFLEKFDMTPNDFDYIIAYWLQYKITDRQNGMIVI